jgi:hypothetical protein
MKEVRVPRYHRNNELLLSPHGKGESMDVWTSESNPVKQTALSIGCFFIGLVMTIGFRNFSGPGLTNSLAGFLLGLFLLIMGIWSFLLSGKQTVVIDPDARRITIKDMHIFTTKTRIIPFRDIVHITIGYLGKKSNYVDFYYLVLTLINGEKYSLFAPGRFYAGGSDRSVVEGWRLRLEEYLRK